MEALILYELSTPVCSVFTNLHVFQPLIQKVFVNFKVLDKVIFIFNIISLRNSIFKTAYNAVDFPPMTL